MVAEIHVCGGLGARWRKGGARGARSGNAERRHRGAAAPLWAARSLDCSAYRPVPRRAGEHQGTHSEPRSIMEIMREGYKEGLPHVACLLGLALSAHAMGRTVVRTQQGREPASRRARGSGRFGGWTACGRDVVPLGRVARRVGGSSSGSRVPRPQSRPL